MRKVRFWGVWAAVLVVAGVFAMAACDDPPSNTTTTVAGANIQSPWEAEYENITAHGFSIKSTTPALPVTDNPGAQSVEYGWSKTPVPPASYQPGLVFANLDEEQVYFVYARTAGKTVGNTIYSPGTPLMASGDPPETIAEAPNASVTWSFGGDIGDYSDWETGEFRCDPAATPVTTGQSPQYILSTIGDATAITTATGWKPGRTFTVQTDITTTGPYYVWSRTAASGNNPPGVPTGRKPLSLPGAKLTRTSWNPTYIATSNSITLTPVAVWTRTPDAEVIRSLPLQYGLAKGTTDAAIAAATWANWTSGPVTISGLDADTGYYLYARTAASGIFKAGDPELYSPSPSNLLYTTIASTNSGGVANDLNAWSPGSASSSGNIVDIIAPCTLGGNLIIPPTVTLKVSEGQSLDAGFFNISGGALIEVYGKLTVNLDFVTTDIRVDAPTGVLIDTSMNASTNLIVSKNSTNPAVTNSVITLNSGSITLKRIGNGLHDYTLTGGAETANQFQLAPSESLIIAESASFEIKNAAHVKSAGRIEVLSGGTLVVPASSYEPQQSLTTNAARIIINYGAVLSNGTTVLIGHKNGLIGNVTSPFAADFQLESPGNPKVEIQRQQKENTATFNTKYTLSGNAVTNNTTISIPSNTYFEVPLGSRLTVSKANTLTVSGGASSVDLNTLDVKGTLVLEEDTTTSNNGGKLNVNGWAVLNGATVTIGKEGTLTVQNNGTFNATGTTIVNGSLANNGTFNGGTLNVYNVLGNSNTFNGGTTTVYTGGSMSASSGTISGNTTISQGATMTLTSTAVFSGTGTTTINGSLTVWDIGAFASLTGNGKVSIAGTLGELTVNSTKLVGFSRTAVPPYAASFLLSGSGTTMEISIADPAATTKVTVFNLRGSSANATVEGDVTLATNIRLVINSGAKLTINTKKMLTLSGTSELHLYGTSTPAALNGPLNEEAGVIKGASESLKRSATATRSGYLTFNDGTNDHDITKATGHPEPFATAAEANWNDTDLIPRLP